MKHSIRLKISILFLITSIATCALFIISLKLELNAHHKEQSEYHEDIVKALNREYKMRGDINISEYFLSRGFILVENSKYAERVKKEGEYYFKTKTDAGLLSSISYSYNLFLQAIKQDENLLFKTRDNTNFGFIFFGFVFSMALCFILYLSMMKSLEPLEKLKRQISKSLSGGGDFLAKDYQGDEIGEIATEFSGTISKMNELVESRRLFLRTIMHEFKTPIGKGRIIAEMMKEKKQKERLVAIFERLDALIEESAKIESLYSKNYKLQIQNYHFDEILERAKKLLLYDNFDEKVRIKKKGDTILKADIDTFVLVVKNLIENAIKYSDDGLCIIECHKDYFVVKNKGKALKQPYTEYLKPFSRDKNSKESGMGLGLYIVDKTCKSHRFGLSYEYKNSFHCFKIIIATPPPLPKNAISKQIQKTIKRSKSPSKRDAKRQRVNDEAQKQRKI